MVARVVVAHRRRERVDPGHVGEVGVLARRDGRGRLVGPGLVGVEQVVAVGVAAGEGGHEVVGGVARRAVVVGHHDVRERHVAGVGHHIGEGRRVADLDQRPGRIGVGLLAIGLLLDVDAGVDAEVVARVVVAHRRRRERVDPGHVGDVGVCARRDGRGRLVGPGLGGVEQAGWGLNQAVELGTTVISHLRKSSKFKVILSN